MSQDFTELIQMFQKTLRTIIKLSKIRVHYWPLNDSNRILQESIHDHPNPFESIIINGRYIHNIYQKIVDETDQNRRKSYQNYRVNKNEGDIKTAQYTGPAILKKTCQESVQTRSVIYMPNHILHQVVYSYPGSLSLNIVYKDNNQKDYYNVMLSDQAQPSDVKTDRQQINGGRKKIILKQIIERFKIFLQDQKQFNQGFI